MGVEIIATLAIRRATVTQHRIAHDSVSLGALESYLVPVVASERNAVQLWSMLVRVECPVYFPGSEY